MTHDGISLVGAIDYIATVGRSTAMKLFGSRQMCITIAYIYTCVNRHRFLTSPNDALSELFLPKYANQHIKEHEGRQETYRYSNMSCTATKMQKEQSTMNLIPSHVPNSCEKKYLTPSVPMTNPTRLAAIIKRMFSTAPMAQTCRYQGCFPYWRLKVVNLYVKEDMPINTPWKPEECKTQASLERQTS